MRNAPRILSAHMGMAASYWQNNFAAGLENAVQIQNDMHEMMRGIQMYLAHKYERDVAPLRIEKTIGKARVLSVTDHDYAQQGEVLLLVPSLINKSDILDLMQERSMLRFMCEKDIHAYLMDWGDVLSDKNAQNLDGAVAQKIIKAIEFLHKKHGKKVHVLGYCMGGTLVAGAAALKPKIFASMICLAAPWDFHAGTQALLNRVKFWSPTLMPSMRDKGHLSVDWLQLLFASLDPALAMHKFIRFAEMDQNSDEAALFVAVEDWLNDGLALPSEMAGQVVKDWFFENAPFSGTWSIQGRDIDPGEIDFPAYIVASSKDRLVEFETAKALADQIPDATLYDPACGHIGMIAGARAVQNVWGPIADWVKHNAGN